MFVRFKVTGTSGTEYLSDVSEEEVSEEQLQAMYDFFQKIEKVKYFKMERDGKVIFFTPSNIESVEIIEVNK